MAKIKMKTNRSAAKRFIENGSGDFKRGKAGKRHILTKKSRKLKRELRTSTILDSTNVKQVKRMLPNG
jgi:large subunit ribosomal protein L35